MKNLKKLFSILMALMMLFSVISAVPITAEAATQKALWVMNDLKVSQVPNGNYSHMGTQNFDVVGVKSNNIMAPFDCKIVKIHKGELYANTVIIESTSKVLYADGTTDYMSMCFGHDNNISDLSVGKKLKQGQVFYQTGDYGNATARHCHMTVIKGKYKGDMWTKNKYDNYCSPNAINPTKGLFITNKTNVVDSKGLKFKNANSSNGHTLTVNYNVNGGKISSDTYKAVDGMVYKKSGNSKFGQKWTYNNAMKDGLYNAKTFGLSRSGYTFIGWGTTSSGGTVFNQDDTSLLPSKINPDVKTKNCSKTLYAIWKKNPAVTKPSVTVNSPSDLTTNSVKINFTAKNPSKVTIKTIGVQVRKKGTSKWTTKQESMNSKYTKSASVPMWWTVGSKKEVNMVLSAGTTYEYRAYVVYNNTKYYSSIKTFTTKKSATKPAVTKPSVTVNSPTDLTKSSVKINFTAKNPSKVTIKTIGVQVRKKGTSKWTTKQESMNSKYTKSASVPMWWTVGSNKELKMKLSAGTTYEYRAYVIYNNTKYYSATKTFTTKK